jgi:type I restriction enzyme M protein
MNLFLHGVEDYSIVNDDTLTSPGFIQNGHLQQFDIVLANPPYSIKQWNREAFASDKWGRNFLGVPPQGRADYAFFQHILASMKPDTGRCAILFPHGVLFRDEEREMREKLVKMDVLECVLGLGPNLFFNASMEACVVICNKAKPESHRGKVLFIDAKKEVTRKNAQSFLEPKHIKKIANTFKAFVNEDGFSKVATMREIEEHESNLNIANYVVDETLSSTGDSLDVKALIKDWNTHTSSVDDALVSLSQIINEL